MTAPILLDLPLPILTPRLSIRPALPGDGAAVHEAIEETFELLQPWMPWAKHEQQPAMAETSVREAYAKFILRQDFRMHGFERDGGRLVVCTGLHDPDWQVRRFEIGYWVRRSAQRRGYASEAANALARYAFAVLDACRVEIRHAEGNAASRGVIHKLGCAHESTRRWRHALPDGRVVDDHVYVLTSPQPLPALTVNWGQSSQ